MENRSAKKIIQDKAMSGYNNLKDKIKSYYKKNKNLSTYYSKSGWSKFFSIPLQLSYSCFHFYLNKLQQIIVGHNFLDIRNGNLKFFTKF